MSPGRLPPDAAEKDPERAPPLVRTVAVSPITGANPVVRSSLPVVTAVPLTATASWAAALVPFTSTARVPVPLTVRFPVTDSTPGPDRPGWSVPARVTLRPVPPAATVPMPRSTPPVTETTPVVCSLLSPEAMVVRPPVWVYDGAVSALPAPGPTTTVPSWVRAATGWTRPFFTVREPVGPTRFRFARPFVALALSCRAAAVPSSRIVALLRTTSAGRRTLPGETIS